MITRRTIVPLAAVIVAALPLGGDTWLLGMGNTPSDCFVGYITAVDPYPSPIRITRRGASNTASGHGDAQSAPRVGRYLRIDDEFRVSSASTLVYVLYAADGTLRQPEEVHGPAQQAIPLRLGSNYADCSARSQALRSGLRRRLITGLLFERTVNIVPAQLASRVWRKPSQSQSRNETGSTGQAATPRQ